MAVRGNAAKITQNSTTGAWKPKTLSREAAALAVSVQTVFMNGP
jgi:hypothetical protein